MGILVIIGIVAGTVTSLAILWNKVIKPAGRSIRRGVEVYDIISSFPEWQDRVNQGLKELHPNHGSSMKDNLDRLSVDMPILRSMVEEHISNSELHNR